MRRREHLRQGDELEEDSGEGGRKRDVAPARLVIQGRGQHRESGDTVEQDRNSEPKQRHNRELDGGFMPEDSVYRSGLDGRTIRVVGDALLQIRLQTAFDERNR